MKRTTREVGLALTFAAVFSVGCSATGGEGELPSSSIAPRPTLESTSSAAPESCAPPKYDGVALHLAPLLDDFLGVKGSSAFNSRWDALQATIEGKLAEDGVPQNTRIKVAVVVGDLSVNDQKTRGTALLNDAAGAPGGQLEDSQKYQFVKDRVYETATVPIPANDAVLSFTPVTVSPC